MRTIFDKVAVNIGQTATTNTLSPGARNQGWRLWDGILRVSVTGAGNVTVEIVATFTGEIVETVAVAGGADKSSNVFKIPGEYLVRVTSVATENVVISIVLDGDTSGNNAQVTVT